MQEEESILTFCLYFTANRFARDITKLAEKNYEFSDLSPSYLYLLMVVHFNPDITQKEICHKLSIAPSTSTRFIDKLVKERLVLRRMKGKESFISLTEEGEKTYQAFRSSLKKLFDDYSEVLGREFSLKLSEMLHEASLKLEK
ncbi:MarR family transcriptional regulator [Paenibacillus aurantius]|uniref:MarR family transcriptional regulator n=1 Tax=Paenibacillus aurantius TaxID=2918900 RepID=A0AA96RCB3_9BACL|nr:MarR family transcriptional regulator [Paenibacillus aurantius]WNQ10345.1 MarR family transcriptional regulator [Paenibacillus aurantius]